MTEGNLDIPGTESCEGISAPSSSQPCIPETPPDAAADHPGPSRLAPASRPGIRHVFMPAGFAEYEHDDGDVATKSHKIKKHKKSKKKKSTKSKKEKKKAKKCRFEKCSPLTLPHVTLSKKNCMLIQFNSIQSLFPYEIYTNNKKHQNNKETKYGGKDRKANKA